MLYVALPLLIHPHFTICKARYILRFLELSCKIALIVEATQMRYIVDRFIRKSQKLFAVIYPRCDDMLEYRHTVYLLVLSRQVEFTDIELR